MQNWDAVVSSLSQALHEMSSLEGGKEGEGEEEGAVVGGREEEEEGRGGLVRTVEPATMSFLEQVKAFSQARGVVGAHGANLANIVCMFHGASIGAQCIHICIYTYIYIHIYIYIYTYMAHP